MKPGCCFMNAASDAQASWSWSASSGSTVKVLIRMTEPTSCSSICSKSETCLSISINCGISFFLRRSWHRLLREHDASRRAPAHLRKVYSSNDVEEELDRKSVV